MVFKNVSLNKKRIFLLYYVPSIKNVNIELIFALTHVRGWKRTIVLLDYMVLPVPIPFYHNCSICLKVLTAMIFFKLYF